VFAQAIALAATFDAPLVHQVADVISTEFRAKYAATVHPDGSADWYRGLTAWSPNINIFRDPRWGRGQETYGEDPYLTSRIGVAFVTGLQGDDPKYLKVVATPKHFAVHSGPESTRHSVDVQASRHDMEDTYLPAFRAAVVEGQADSAVSYVPGPLLGDVRMMESQGRRVRKATRGERMGQRGEDGTEG
jgi:beta-glucosidase